MVEGARLDLGPDDIAQLEPGDIIVLENHEIRLEMGFVSGFAAGVVSARYLDRLSSARLQGLFGASTILLVASAWLIGIWS